MNDARAKWEQVGDQMSELGLKLKLHFEQAGGAERSEEEDRVREALHTLGDTVEQAFNALSTAARDDAVRTDVKDVGRSVVDALEASFAELGERMRS